MTTPDPAKPDSLPEPTKLPGSEIASLRRALQASESELRSLKKTAAANAELAELRKDRIEGLEERVKTNPVADNEIALRDEYIASLQEELRQSEHQLHLLRRSVVVRLWNRLRRIPPLSWVLARRKRG